MKKIIALITGVSLSLSLSTPAEAVTKPVIDAVTSTSEAGTSPDQASVQVAWSDSGDATGYTTYAVDSITEEVISGSPAAPTANGFASSFTDLSSDRSYEFFVQAFNTSDESSAESDGQSFVPKSVPFAPVSGSITAGQNQISLAWTAPSISQTGGLPLTGFRITSTNGSINEYISDEQSSSTVLTDISEGTYTLRIRAENALGLSEADDYQQVTVAGISVPDAPDGVDLAEDGGSLVASWNDPTDDGGSAITGYVVYLYEVVPQTGGGSQNTLVSQQSVGGTVETAAFSNLSSGDYFVNVAAGNSEGLSPRSSNSVTVSLDSGLQLQTITLSEIPNQVAPKTLQLSTFATASSGLTVSFSVSGACRLVSASEVTLSAAGTCFVVAEQEGDDQFAAARAVSRSFVVTVDSTDSGDDSSSDDSGGGGGGGGGGAVGSAPVVEVSPFLVGTSAEGETLAVSDGTWATEDLSFSYQWHRCDEPLAEPTQLQVLISCDLVQGATQKTYPVTSADQGFYLLASVAASSGFYSTTAFTNTIDPGETIEGEIDSEQDLDETPASDAATATGFWTKRNGDNVKLYAKNVIGLGKVQFFMNDEEIAWIRAEDLDDPKLRVITEGPMTGASYLVRDRDLPRGKNVFEIYVDGERVERRVASLN